MLNETITIEPEIEKPQAPEKIEEQPITAPNPFKLPIPQIQPGTAPIPKA